MDSASNAKHASSPPVNSKTWVEAIDANSESMDILKQPWKEYLEEDAKRYQGPDLAKTDCVGANPPTPSLSA